MESFAASMLSEAGKLYSAKDGDLEHTCPA